MSFSLKGICGVFWRVNKKIIDIQITLTLKTDLI